MARNRNTAIMLAALWLLLTIFVSGVFFVYLPISPERPILTMSALVAGLLGAMLVQAVVAKLPEGRWGRISAGSFVFLLLLLPLLSASVSRVTYSRFGLTVYGVMPIPFLDITVNRRGHLWFRPKTHQITRAEIEALVTPDVEVVIVGIGWDSIARLTDDAQLLDNSIDLRVLSTPAAFALYNQLRSQGRTVVLLAHTTC